MTAALAWAEATGEAALGLRLAAAQGRFWHHRGFAGMERRRVEALLALAGASLVLRDRLNPVTLHTPAQYCNDTSLIAE